jgi:23S rRNA (pseudouridine1915-N3)-methyltransferase
VRLRIVALGLRLPAWMNEGYEDYARRLPREWPLELVELRPEARNENSETERLLRVEASRIAPQIEGDWIKVVLDERGERVGTEAFAKKLAAWDSAGLRAAFVIGSADGLAAEVKQGADWLLSLSALTLPHGLARVLLAEQLYRAVSLLRGHPYHRK